jgi:hypothetical protein
LCHIKDGLVGPHEYPDMLEDLMNRTFAFRVKWQPGWGGQASVLNVKDSKELVAKIQEHLPVAEVYTILSYWHLHTTLHIFSKRGYYQYIILLYILIFRVHANKLMSLKLLMRMLQPWMTHLNFRFYSHIY